MASSQTRTDASPDVADDDDDVSVFTKISTNLSKLTAK